MKVNKLGNNISFSILNNVLTLFVLIASGMIIGRLLGPEGKGTLYLINQIVAIGAVFFSLGLGPALLYYLKQNKFTKNEATTFSVVYSIIITGTIALLLFFFKDYLISLLNNTITLPMLIFGVVLIVLNLLITFWGFVLMDDETGVKTCSIISIIGNLLYILVLFALVFGFSKGVVGALIALLLSCLARIVILFKYLFMRGFSYSKMPAENIQPIFKYGLSIFISNLFLTGVYRIDVFFVNKILSVSELGIYSASVNVSELLLLVPSAIGVALFPHLASLDYKERTLTMGRMGRLSMILGIVGSMAIMVVAYPFIIVVFGEKFKDAFIPALLLLPGLVSMTLNYAYSNYLFSIGKPFVAAKIFLLGVLVNVLLNWYFLKEFGINGAAVFSSITYTIITIGFILAILKNDKHLKLRDIAIPNGNDFKFIFYKVQSIIKVKK